MEPAEPQAEVGEGEAVSLAEGDRQEGREEGGASVSQPCGQHAGRKEAQINLRKRESNLKVRYGITSEDWENLALRQGGVCAICGSSGGQRGLFVDHCHTGGHVRGLLCNDCNQAVGRLKDSRELAKRLADYLEAYQSRGPLCEAYEGDH